MPRPKGSKNKTTLEREQEQPVAVEFDYDRDDGRFDNSYNPLSVTGSSSLSSDFVSIQGETITVDPFSQPAGMRLTEPSGNKMFLVEGEVQLASRIPGQGTVVAKQFRLVMAVNEEQAIGKYASYFRGLSDQQSVYAVVSAAAMETIV